jgi:protein-ribulosamine 3-kinase
MFHKEIRSEVVNKLETVAGHAVNISAIEPVGGGCINSTCKITTSAGTFFVKYNLSEKYPEIFAKEALGLKLLAETKEIRVPSVLFHDIAGNYAFLLLEFIEPARPESNFWDNFGQSLAAMHRHTHNFFGLDHDNYMGSLHQINRKHGGWTSFFIEERLEPQVRLAHESGELSGRSVRQFEQLYKQLSGMIPAEAPALLHGDLWSGNYMVSDQGKACLVDPAVYYGHREVDIAMTRLFGGFPEIFYQGYASAFPLERGWQDRSDLFNLYPLLIHVNLFGGSYANQVCRILDRFVG